MAQKIIDIHTHVFPDELAERAVKQLTGRSGETAFTDGTAAGLKQSMAQSGISLSVVQPVSTKASQVASINSFSIAMLDDPRLVPFGTLFPEQAGLKEETRRLSEAGIKGVKFHPDYQAFYVDEERLFPTYEAMEEGGLIAFFHAGVDIGLEPPYHCTPERLVKVLDRFPGLTVVAAHFGGFRMWEEVDQHLVGRNLYLDCSYTLDYLPHADFVRMSRTHGIGKVLFGTDSPWADQAKEVRMIRETGLTEEELSAVMWDNAARLLGLDVVC